MCAAKIDPTLAMLTHVNDLRDLSLKKCRKRGKQGEVPHAVVVARRGPLREMTSQGMLAELASVNIYIYIYISQELTENCNVTVISDVTCNEWSELELFIKFNVCYLSAWKT